MSEQKTIRVKWVNAEPGYYRDYYVNEVTGAFYTLTNCRDVHEWHTTDSVDGEPDMPLKDGLIIEIVENGKVIHKEKISRVNDCAAVGLPIVNE